MVLATLAVLAFTSALKWGIFIGLIFWGLWYVQKKLLPMFEKGKNKKSARENLESVDESIADAKDSLSVAKEIVEHDKEEAEQVLKDSEDLEKEVEEKSKIIP